MSTTTKVVLIVLAVAVWQNVKKSVDKEFGSGQPTRNILPPESESFADRLKALAEANKK